MAVHAEISPAEAADRLAIRELFDAYARCADRRDADGQKSLFTADTRLAVHVSGPGTEPTYVLEGREALTPVFEALNQYWTGARPGRRPREMPFPGRPVQGCRQGLAGSRCGRR